MRKKAKNRAQGRRGDGAPYVRRINRPGASAPELVHAFSLVHRGISSNDRKKIESPRFPVYCIPTKNPLCREIPSRKKPPAKYPSLAFGIS